MSHSSSSSQANQTQTTNTQDQRINAAAGSIVLGAGAKDNSLSWSDTSTHDDHSVINNTENNTSNVTTIDAGAVGASFDFANSIADGAASELAASMKAQQQTSADALKAVQASYASSAAIQAQAVGATQEAYGDAMGKLSDGYSNASKSVERAWSGATDSVSGIAKLALSDVMTTNQDNNQRVADAYKNTASTLADAYQTAKAGEQKIVAAAAMAILGIVAIRVLGK
jgi:hypothetical protein